MTAPLTYRIFSVESAVESLARDIATVEPTENERLRLYVLREKLDAIIAGESTQVYEKAWRKWYDGAKQRDEEYVKSA